MTTHIPPHDGPRRDDEPGREPGPDDVPEDAEPDVQEPATEPEDGTDHEDHGTTDEGAHEGDAPAEP